MLRRIAPLVALGILIATVVSTRPHAQARHRAAVADPDLITASSTQPFSGQITDNACGSTTFTADASSTINVTVTAQVATNDIAVNLVYGGTVVHSEDT